MGIRKEAEHEQWLAALRNNVVFVGSFYLPAAQECSLQSDSKFKAVAQPDQEEADHSNSKWRNDAQFTKSSKIRETVVSIFLALSSILII